MKIKFVDLHAQYQAHKDEIDHAIHEVIEKTAFIGGHYVEKFEEEFAEFIGAEHCVSCGNGTDALQIALRAFEIREGDEVIVKTGHGGLQITRLPTGRLPGPQLLLLRGPFLSTSEGGRQKKTRDNTAQNPSHEHTSLG